MDEGYKKITKYCHNHGVGLVLRNHAVCFYLQSYEQAVDGLVNTTPRNMQMASAALLTDQAIEGYVTRAREFHGAVVEEVVESLQRPDWWSSFRVGVASSVTGSFVFSLLLVLGFWLGRDQLLSWISALYRG